MSVKFALTYDNVYSRKCIWIYRLRKWRPFCSGPIGITDYLWVTYWGGWGCEVSCGGHHRLRGKTTTAGLNNPIGPIARNCPKWPSGNHICGPKLPAKLVFWKFGQQTFSCVNQLLNHCTPYTLLILRGVLQSDCHLVLNQVLFMIPTISSPLYLVWLYGQLIIEPWYESSMIQCK